MTRPALQPVAPAPSRIVASSRRPMIVTSAAEDGRLVRLDHVGPQGVGTVDARPPAGSRSCPAAMAFTRLTAPCRVWSGWAALPRFWSWPNGATTNSPTAGVTSRSLGSVPACCSARLLQPSPSKSPAPVCPRAAEVRLLPGVRKPVQIGIQCGRHAEPGVESRRLRSPTRPCPGPRRRARCRCPTSCNVASTGAVENMSSA